MYREQSHSFTLVEIVLVLAILALLLAVVLPNVGRIPGKYNRAKAVESLQKVFSEASLRARTTGQVVQLVLNPDSATAVTRELSSASTEKRSVPARHKDEEESSAFWSSKENYSDKIKWDTHGKEPVSREMTYRFYPNGEAAGPDVFFMVGEQQYRLVLDNLTSTVSVISTD